MKKPKVIAGTVAVILGITLVVSMGVGRKEELAETFYPGDLEALASFEWDGATYYPVKTDVPAEFARSAILIWSAIPR